MLTAFAKHSLIDLEVESAGDLHIDAHHSVEDTAIVLGQAIRSALRKSGIRRFGDALVPLDEALAQAVVDVSGRPYCVHTGEPTGQEYVLIGGSQAAGVAASIPYSGSLTRHIMETLAFHAQICLHLTVISGRDPHHIVECQFKAVARASAMRLPSIRGSTAYQAPKELCDDSCRPRLRIGQHPLGGAGSRPGQALTSP